MTFESLEELETAQQMAAERYPEIAHLSEFITGPDANSVMELAADISRRLKAANRQPGPHTTADTREETPPVEEPEQRRSAAIIAGFREGKTRPSDPDAASSYFTARLREAAS